MEVVVETSGVTHTNEESVCDAFAAAVGGTYTYCSLFGSNPARRSLAPTSSYFVHEQNLYMDISVTFSNSGSEIPCLTRLV